MGACLSSLGGGKTIIEPNDGGEKEFHGRYIEDRVLGEGEFGVVTLVHDLTRKNRNNSVNNGINDTNNTSKIDTVDGSVCAYDNSSMAAKALRKGVVFKYNTLYAPLKPDVLRREVDILRKLRGQNFCLDISAVYETPRVIYLITELCAGGDMYQYLSNRENDLRTDEVSRISFQLLSAVDHCAKNDVINRDIKPENTMFVSPSSDSQLRLIDFGSGTNKCVEGFHTTFAGTAFYISPEMFQNTYTQKTDVWSAGVCLYVLVAGYPSDKLQTAFNIMHKITPGERNLKTLPNLPDNLPDSYYVMLNQLLEYKHKKRKKACDILEYDFVRFHKLSSSYDNSNVLGSVERHSLFLDYQKFERCLTTLLATMLTKNELIIFVEKIQNKAINKTATTIADEESTIAAEEVQQGAQKIEDIVPRNQGELLQPKTNHSAESKILGVVNIQRVIDVLKENELDSVIMMIEKLPGADLYGSFAYDVSVLTYFVGIHNGGGREKQSGTKKHHTSSRVNPLLGKIRDGFDSSIHSVGAKIRGLDFSSHL